MQKYDFTDAEHIMLLACVEYVVNMLGADAPEHFGFDAEQWQRVVALLPPDRSILE